jgi:hypothetical protein
MAIEWYTDVDAALTRSAGTRPILADFTAAPD